MTRPYAHPTCFSGYPCEEHQRTARVVAALSAPRLRPLLAYRTRADHADKTSQHALGIVSSISSHFSPCLCAVCETGEDMHIFIILKEATQPNNDSSQSILVCPQADISYETHQNKVRAPSLAFLGLGIPLSAASFFSMTTLSSSMSANDCLSIAHPIAPPTR